MIVERTPIPGLLVVRLDVHEDARGWFKENWQREKMVAAGLPDFGPVQNNVSFNARRGATRGIHTEPWDKFVTVTTGRVFGAWVDMREGDELRRDVLRRDRPGRGRLRAARGRQLLPDPRGRHRLQLPRQRPLAPGPGLPRARPRRPGRRDPVADPARGVRDLREGPAQPAARRGHPDAAAPDADHRGQRPARPGPGRRVPAGAHPVDRAELDLTDDGGGRRLAVARVRRGPQRGLLHRGRRRRDRRRPPRRLGRQRRRPRRAGPGRGAAPADAGALLHRLRLRRHRRGRTPRTSRSPRWASTARARRPATSRSPRRRATTCCAPRG